MCPFKENDTVTIANTGEKAFFLKQITTCPVKGGPPVPTRIAKVQLIDTDEIVDVLIKELSPYKLYN